MRTGQTSPLLLATAWMALPRGPVWASYLTLVQPGILHSAVQLAQLLVGVAHVLVPEPRLTLCRNVEQLPHLLLDGC